MYEGVWPPQRKRNSVITNLERVDWFFRPSYERGMIAPDGSRSTAKINTIDKNLCILARYIT